MNAIYNAVLRSCRCISYQNGILQRISKVNRANEDPYAISIGIVSCDTSKLGGVKYGGRSSGCGYEIYDAYMSTIGETIERYCPAFFRINEMLCSSYENLVVRAVHPNEYALFHEDQYQKFKINSDPIIKFSTSTKVYWDKCIDLTTGEETYCPATFLYLPWKKDEAPIFYGVSTGLSAHTNYHKAILTSLYEVIERDSFVLTWFQRIVPAKIILTADIQKYIRLHFPNNYTWHFFDITYDLGVPTVFGICEGRSDFGDFIAVGTATRETKGDAMKKVIQEIAQTIPYFRYALSNSNNWEPSEEFSNIVDFEKHSIFYLKKKEYRKVFDPWLSAVPSLIIDFNERKESTPEDAIRNIISILKNKGYNVLLKDLTTPDAYQMGFFCIRIVVPQLLQMTGAYKYYPLGGKRLYEVPTKMGFPMANYGQLNPYPHPFP